MNRRVVGLAALAAVASPAALATATPTKSLTKARAEAAIEKKVKTAYRSQVGGRDIDAGCRRLSAKRYRCEYGVLLGDQDETDDQDRNPYKYEGTGSVTKSRSGKLVVSVTRPR